MSERPKTLDPSTGSVSLIKRILIRSESVRFGFRLQGGIRSLMMASKVSMRIHKVANKSQPLFEVDVVMLESGEL
eukprot:8182819-Pyramimonas_sp.AAC.1